MIMKGIIIMGFPKCGTTSLLSYLQSKYTMEIAKEAGFYPYDYDNKISRREWCYQPFEEQLKRFQHDFIDPEDFKLVFITRDPVERIWSGWESWNHYYKGMSFNEYLDLKTETYEGGLSYLGEVNPIIQTDYKHWIDYWKGYNMDLYTLEEVRKDPLFPQTNSLKKSQIPENCRELVEKYLKKEKKS